MNNLKENIVQSLLSSPTCSYLWNRQHFSSIIGCSSTETPFFNYVHHTFALLGVIPTANPTTGLQVSSSNLEILNSTHSKDSIDQLGAYTFHLVEEHQRSPTSVGGHWKVSNAPMLALSAGTEVVAAVTREQPCCNTALSLQLPALPGIHPLMGLSSSARGWGWTWL